MEISIKFKNLPIMKKNMFFFSTILCSVGIIILFELAGCKKTSTGHTASDNTFSFSYNGIQYSLGPNDEYRVDSMNIQITRLDIFSAAIEFQKPDCAYYATDNTVVIISGNFKLTNGSGLAIDSAAVYIYQSGSFYI